MTKTQLLRKFKSQYAIAKFFGLSRQAVAQWPADQPIPELRMYQLRERKPEWFKGKS